MVKVLLIKPPHWGLYHEIGRHVPIGLAYLAAAGRGGGHEVAIIDALSFTEDNRVLAYDELSAPQRAKVDRHPTLRHVVHWGASWERLERAVREFGPDLVGLSLMYSPFYETGFRAAELVRRLLPAVPIVAGGSHATVAYRHVLAHPAFDYVVLGEGEVVFAALLDSLERGEKKPHGLKGLAFRDHPGDRGHGVYANEDREWIDDLDALGHPAVDLLDFGRYEGTTTIITSRGCPFSCSFCTVHPTAGTRHRARSPENVVAEMEWYINRFGINKFNIEDDNFTFDPGRAEAIMDLIIARKLEARIELPNGIAVIGMTERMAEKMIRAGVRDLFFGLESPSPDVLRKIGKPFTSLEKVKTALGWFERRGLPMGASLIMGLPDQDLPGIVADLVTLLLSGVHFGTANPFYPTPGARIWSECRERGLVSDETDFSWLDEFNFPIETSGFSRRDLADIWIASLAAETWPEVFQRAAVGHHAPAGCHAQTLEELVGAFDLYPGKGVAWFEADGFSFVPGAGMSFSELQRLRPGGEHGDVVVDVLTGEMIAALTYVWTGFPHRATQVESLLAGDPQTRFVVRPDAGRESRAIRMLIEKLDQGGGSRP